MNFLEQALQRVGNRTNQEVLQNPTTLEVFDEEGTEQRIQDLHNIIEAGRQYLDKDNKIAIDALIEDLQKKIDTSEPGSDDVRLLQRELGEYLFKRDSADVHEDVLKEKRELEDKLRHFMEQNMTLSN